MGLWHFGATALDRWVAKTVARYTSPAVERPARVLTWAADEHVLGVIAGGLWLAARAGNDRERRQTDHLALSMVVTAILPHLLKRLIDQKRQDRCMVHGPRRDIPRSGKPYDASIRPFLVDEPLQQMRQDGGHYHAQSQMIGL